MREQFKKWWSERDDARHRFQNEEWFLANATEILYLFPPGGRLLDVGCGNAQLLSYLAPHYEQVVGIDYSTKMLEGAQKRLAAFGIVNAELLLGDACELPLNQAPFDVILSSQVIQNLEESEIATHLHQCQRALRPGGVVGMCGIPWANLMRLYRSGGLQDPVPRRDIRRSIASLRKRIRLLVAQRRSDVMGDGVGYWYRRSDIARIAETAGFDCQIVSAWYYEYRFHARLTRGCDLVEAR